MSRYVITVAPDDPTDGTELTVRVETDATGVHVREVAMRAPSGSGLAHGRMPDVDLDMLAGAFARHLADIAATGTSHRAAPAPARSAPAPTQARRGPAKATGSKSAAGARRTRRTAPTTDRTTAGGETAKVPAASPLGAGRAYRKMPDAAELESVYAQVGSITGVAAHYGVPRHTAQGWFGRLRRG